MRRSFVTDHSAISRLFRARAIFAGLFSLLLIGALLIHGIQPGPLLFENQRPFVFTIVFLLAAASILTMLLGLLGVRHVALEREQALRRTWQRRPDLLLTAVLSQADKQFLAQLAEEESAQS